MGRLGLFFLVAILVACSSPKQVSVAPQKPMGLLEVTITGIGEGAVADASARWVQAEAGKQALTIVPVNGTSALNDIQFTRRAISFYDQDLSAERYITATFDLVNRTTTAFDNLTLFAVNVPGTTQGGTGIVVMRDGNDAVISDESIYRQMTPVHSVRPTLNGFQVNPTIADLQLITPLEALSAEVQGKTMPVGSPILPSDASVLEYGFVGRNLSGGRAIAARNLPAGCTNASCTGTITFAYRLPKLTPRRVNPFAFVLYFLVGNETESQVSQSTTEQTDNTVAGNTSTAGFSQVRTLAGSPIFSLDSLRPVCQIKTAVTTGLNPNPVLFPALPTPTSGSLDLCFGGRGFRTTDLSENDTLRDLAIQSDGKIIGVGHSDTIPGGGGQDTDVVVIRLNPSGALDKSFGGDGKVVTSFGTGTDLGLGIAQQSDGKIVVVGVTNLPSPGFGQDVLLARYNSDGSLDSTFDSDGKAVISIGTTYDWATDVAIQTDGRIVLGGWGTGPGASIDFTLARLNSNGSLDTTFDIDGKVTTHFSGSSDDRISRIALQTDGKIVVAGFSDSDGNPLTYNSDFALARYNANGSLDTGFDTDGRLTTDFGIDLASANDLALQPDGKIVAAGYTLASIPNLKDFALARYNSNGSLDTGFDIDGKVTTDMGSSNEMAIGVVIQGDGKIVVGGDTTSDFALARYNTNGSLDIGFDGDGKSIVVSAATTEQANAMALQSDGKIILAGEYDFAAIEDFAWMRFNP